MNLRNILILLLALYWQKSVGADLTITFKHLFKSQGVQLTPSDIKQSPSFTRIKYYISNVIIQFQSGEVYNDNHYHLIDVEKQVEGFTLTNVPKGTIEEIQFGIGVDSLRNVNGIMDGDLDPMNGMYWAWNSGYINFKVEGLLDEEEEFQYHIGGFQAPFQSYQVVTLYPQYSSSEEEIYIDVDLDALFKKMDFSVAKKILSPSKGAVEFSKILPQIFNVSE